MAEVPIDVGVLRELLRNLVAWRAVYESDGIEELVGPDGRCWIIWDIEYLYKQVPELPPQQARAIELCLIQNMKERDAAVAMGVSPTNPVAMYASLGLKKIVGWANDGSLDRFRGDWDMPR